MTACTLCKFSHVFGSANNFLQYIEKNFLVHKSGDFFFFHVVGKFLLVSSLSQQFSSLRFVPPQYLHVFLVGGIRHIRVPYFCVAIWTSFTASSLSYDSIIHLASRSYFLHSDFSNLLDSLHSPILTPPHTWILFSMAYSPSSASLPACCKFWPLRPSHSSACRDFQLYGSVLDSSSVLVSFLAAFSPSSSH